MMSATGVIITQMYRKMEEQVKNENYELLDIMHHLTSGLKAIYAPMAYSGIDECRKACGGAGFNASSMLPHFFF